MADDDRRFRKRGRLRRLARMGQMAASVSGSLAAEKISGVFRAEENRENAREKVLIDQAKKAVRTLGDLKGAAMKMGQMLSTLPDHQLPDVVRQELSSLQRDTPPMDYDLVAERFREGTQHELRDEFRRFDPEPIGAASIGQVHRALRFDGREVAVKIQYPGILDTLDADIQNVWSLMQLGRMVADGGQLRTRLEELKAGLLMEADYTKEAGFIRDFASQVAAFPGIVVPKVHEDLSTETVLVMDFIEGEKLDDAGLNKTPEERARLAELLAGTFIKMFHELHFLHADPHPGNFLLTPAGEIAILDWGCVREFEPAFTDGWLKLVIALWKEESKGLRAAFDDVGFHNLRGFSGLTDAQLYELSHLTATPVLYDGDFDWGGWNPKPEVERYVKANLGVMGYVPPAEATFYYRTAIGLWGLFARWEAQMNARQLVQASAEARGLWAVD